MAWQIREREGALSALSGRLDSARAGDGGSLFLVGEAGLGKTTLLDRAADQAGRSMRIFRGRGEPMETRIAFGLVDQLFGPEARGDAPFIGVLTHITEEAERSPVLVLLDDLQWADRDSLELIAFLARRLEPLPIALVGALRPWPPEAATVIRDLGAERAPTERLAPLARESTDALLTERAGREVPDETLSLAWRMSSGNPLLADQIAVMLDKSGELPGVLDLDDASSDLLLGRFAGLDESALDLARVASVAGVRFRTGLITRVAGADPETADTGYEALFRSGLVISDGKGWLRFVHPLLSQAIYDNISPPSRERIHRELYLELLGAGFETEAAEHAIAAGLEGDPQAAELLERVGHAARAAGAVAVAARILEYAVRFRGESCRPELRIEAANSLLAAGLAADAERIMEPLVWTDKTSPALRAEALRAMARASYLLGSGDRGDRQMAEAVELAIETDPASAVKPLLELSAIVWLASGPQKSIIPAERAVEIAREESQELLELALAVWGHLAVETGDPAGLEALGPYDRRMATGDTDHLFDLAELVWAPAAIYGYSHTLKYAERFDDSLAAMTRARETLEEAGAIEGITTVTLFIANHLARQGRLEEALVEADRGEEFLDLTPWAVAWAPLIRAECFVWMGRFEEADAQLATARERAIDPENWLFRLWSSHVGALGMLWRRDLSASDLYLEIEELGERVGMRELSSQPWEDHAVEAHLAAGRLEDAERMTVVIEERAAAIGTGWPRSIAHLARGRIQAASGDPSARESFELAVAAMANTDMPLHRAEALLALGSWLRRNRATVEARAPLAEAQSLAEYWGSEYLSSLATEELHLAGGRRRNRSNETRDHLTPAELRVAREAAAGRTNAEIARHLHISPNTVQSHLKRVFAKLEIGSRRRLSEKLETLEQDQKLTHVN